MKKSIQIVIILLLFSGCGSIKQGWNNFTAYYNTFYNTQNFYDEGLRINRSQIPEMNPNQLIRIHPSPSNAGLNEFQSAIERGSSILLNHDESRYFLPAIFIIGKSYYYRSEFFSALEKFQELATFADGDLRQKAFLWQGLTYLEMSNYSEGIQQLEAGMDRISNWNPEILAEVYAVLAQLNSELDNYDLTIEFLYRSVSDLNNDEMAARAYFLLGQIYELTGNHVGARNAYRDITGFITSFELEFHAIRKEAEVLRRMGNYDQAERLFRRLFRDNKYLAFTNELQYEIGRTLQLKGDYEEALIRYEEVLEDHIQTPSAVTRAKTYYGIAEIYREHLQDYGTAADYFERAASQRADPALLPVGFNANELAESFGRYATIKREISEKDSLLALAAMSDDDLKEYIEEVQQIEQEKLEEELREVQRQQSQAVVMDEPDQLADLDQTVEFGFLNSKNRSKQLESSLQFQARWGDRPLADNWRRQEAVSGNRFDQIVLRNEKDEEITIDQDDSGTGIQAMIELSDIPFSEEEQLSLRNEINRLNYQLANVFFLTLDMPDSAAVYYRKVIDSDLNQDLVTMSMYSLAELALELADTENATTWLHQLNEVDPNSVYTRRLAERLGLTDHLQTGSVDKPGTEFVYQNLKSDQVGTNHVERANLLLSLAEQDSSDDRSALLIFDAANEYLQAAKSGTDKIREISNWILMRDQYEQEKDNFEQQRDSSIVMLADSTLSDSARDYWQSIADSTFSETDFSGYFPYQGAYWDSTRTILNRIETQYASTAIMPRVRVLSEELRNPSVDQSTDSSTPAEIDQVPGAAVSISEIGVNRDVIENQEDADRTDSVENTNQTDDSTSSYSIVLYSFSRDSLARIQATELASMGMGEPIYICPKVINNTNYWRVSVGSYPEISGAIRSTNLLSPPYDNQNFITSLNPNCVQFQVQ
ncbi:MAG: tetratricopeptide repeat protein [Balneolaceae bacterium]